MSELMIGYSKLYQIQQHVKNANELSIMIFY